MRTFLFVIVLLIALAAGANATTFKYDNAGRLIASTDDKGITTLTEYNAKGQISAKGIDVDGDGKLTAKDKDVKIYDGLGALTSTVDSAGTTTSIELDDARRPKKITSSDPKISETVYEYEPGTYNVASEKNSSGEETSFEYYPNGLQKEKHSKTSGDVSYEYDTSGRRTKEIDALNGKTTTKEWIYNGNTGWLETEKTDGVITKRYTYRDNGQILSAQDENYVVSTYQYGPAGDVVGVTTSDQKTPPIEYERDRMGRVIGLKQGKITMSYELALDGARTKMTIKEESVPDITIEYGYNQPGSTVLTSTRITSCDKTIALEAGYDPAIHCDRLAWQDLTAAYTYADFSGKVAAMKIGTKDKPAAVERVFAWLPPSRYVTNMAWTCRGKPFMNFEYHYKFPIGKTLKVVISDGTRW